MKKLLAIAFLALASGWCSAQSNSSFTLTVNANAGGTATVLRAPGDCPSSGVPSSGTTITSALAVVTTPISTQAPLGFQGIATDATVVPGGKYCYWATLAGSGGGSGVSNTFLGSVSITVTLSGK